MRKKIIIFLLMFLTGTYIFILLNKAYSKKEELICALVQVCKPDRTGEKIIYDVMFGKVNLGRAQFTHLPKTELRGKEVNLMTFETKLVRFTDLERIYSDPESFLPLRVERYVSTWPSSEKITEDYDQEKFILTIKKFKGNKKEEMIIKKNNSINNAILLPYHVRNMPGLEVGYNLAANLPTRDFVIKLVAKEEIAVPAGKFMSYRFKSMPNQFEIWISADERRIPVKIKGATSFGYVLVMKEYTAPAPAKDLRLASE